MNETFAEWLDARCRDVAALEARGKEAVAAGDADAYRDAMRRKAELLAELFKNATPHLDGLAPDQRESVVKQLKRFSAAARHALSLGSVFYMSALLYRDDHKEGEPNNLEVFRGGLHA